jgi:hypothetical protein
MEFRIRLNAWTIDPFGVRNALWSAIINATNSPVPLAAVVDQYSGNISQAYNPFSSGAPIVFAPLIMNDYYGWNTSVNIQNLSASQATVTVTYYRINGTVALTHVIGNLPGYASISLYSPNEGLPDTDPNRPGNNFIGSAKITTGSASLAVVVNQSTSSRSQSYSGIISCSDYVVIPDLYNHYGSIDWVSSVNVMNLGSSPTNAKLMFGNQSFTPAQIAVNGSVSIYVPTFWGWTSLRGPALVRTNNGQPIGVIVNSSKSTQTNDLARSYNGICR